MNAISFTRGVPAEESFPVDDLIGCAESALREHGKTLLQYHPVRGFMPLREALAGQEGVAVERVMVGNGSIHLFDLLVRTLLSPGDTVLVERPTYDRSITVLRNAGARVVGIPLESDGVDLTALETALLKHAPRLAYLIPDFQNPSGATMSTAKREAVVELCARHDVQIVIDVPYRPLRYWGSEAPSLFELAPECVIQLSSYSKLISPGMRVGWMIAPPEILDRIAGLAEDTYISPGMLPQGVVYEFLHRGLLPAAIERLKGLYAPRLRAILDSLDSRLPEAAYFRPEGGFFLGLTLPTGVTGAEVRRLAPENGLRLSDGAGFYADGDGSRFLRLPFCALTERQIEEAVRRLARTVEAARAACEEASHG